MSEDPFASNSVIYKYNPPPKKPGKKISALHIKIITAAIVIILIGGGIFLIKSKFSTLVSSIIPGDDKLTKYCSKQEATLKEEKTGTYSFTRYHVCPTGCETCMKIPEPDCPPEKQIEGQPFDCYSDIWGRTTSDPDMTTYCCSPQMLKSGDYR